MGLNSKEKNAQTKIKRYLKDPLYCGWSILHQQKFWFIFYNYETKVCDIGHFHPKEEVQNGPTDAQPKKNRSYSLIGINQNWACSFCLKKAPSTFLVTKVLADESN